MKRRETMKERSLPVQQDTPVLLGVYVSWLSMKLVTDPIWDALTMKRYIVRSTASSLESVTGCSAACKSTVHWLPWDNVACVAHVHVLSCSCTWHALHMYVTHVSYVMDLCHIPLCTGTRVCVGSCAHLNQVAKEPSEPKWPKSVN
jgi:hypothetical protein